METLYNGINEHIYGNIYFCGGNNKMKDIGYEIHNKYCPCMKHHPITDYVDFVDIALGYDFDVYNRCFEK